MWKYTKDVCGELLDVLRGYLIAALRLDLYQSLDEKRCA